MTIEDLGNLGDFVGGIAVVATLIYVVLQLRQNNKLLRSNTDAIRASSLIAFQSASAQINAPIVRDLTFAALLVRASSGLDSLTPEERLQVHAWMLTAFLSGDTALKLFRSGATDEQEWEVQSRHLIGLLEMPGVREWATEIDTPFSEEFKSFVKDALARVET